ncbi:hypothetical protein ACA910_001197 [Epithemia clementina (nom. ined.)]
MKSKPACYMFGYGSIICSNSRSMTCPELSDRSAIPVLIHGIERTWNKRASTMGMTAMGIRFRAKARCAGVLVPLYSNDELQLFDKREIGYKRVRVDPKKVDKIPFLDKKTKNGEDDDDEGKNKKYYNDFFSKQLRAGNVDVWVYVPEKTRPPTKCHPIAQSYVDTILRGCLATGGEDLCAEFLETTKGWHPEELEEETDSSSSSEEEDTDEEEEVVALWINDRSNPVYQRGDPQHSRQNAHKFDRLIRRYRPEYINLRQEQEESAKN